MICPKCKTRMRVTQSIPYREIRVRYYVCDQCGEQVETNEKAVEKPEKKKQPELQPELFQA